MARTRATARGMKDQLRTARSSDVGDGGGGDPCRNEKSSGIVPIVPSARPSVGDDGDAVDEL